MVESYLLRERDRFPEAGSLNWSIEPGLIAYFEADSFETVLRNLLENAVLYTDQPPRVSIKLRKSGNMAHLIFSDCGYGIPSRYQKKVFRIFYRIRNNHKTIRGSGLGLFIVRNVIRLHGGKVWLESPNEHNGCTFHIMLPLAAKKSSDE